jgi:hypothetical protein
MIAIGVGMGAPEHQQNHTEKMLDSAQSVRYNDPID